MRSSRRSKPSATPSASTAWGDVELHAVGLSGEEIPHVARCEGDGDEELYLAACALAEMVGLRLDR